MHVIPHLGLSGGSWVDTQVGHRRVWQTLPSVPEFWPEQAVLSHIRPHAALLHPLSIFCWSPSVSLSPSYPGPSLAGQMCAFILDTCPECPPFFCQGYKATELLDSSWHSLQIHSTSYIHSSLFPKLQAACPCASGEHPGFISICSDGNNIWVEDSWFGLWVADLAFKMSTFNDWILFKLVSAAAALPICDLISFWMSPLACMLLPRYVNWPIGIPLPSKVILQLGVAGALIRLTLENWLWITSACD